MKKLFLAAAFATSTFFAANAQSVGAHLSYHLPTGEGAEGYAIGIDAQGLFDVSGGLALGVEGGGAIMMGLPEDANNMTQVWVQAIGKYFIGGDSEVGGFYPQINLGFNQYREDAFGETYTSTGLQYGVGAGFKLEAGPDIAVRYNINKLEFFTAKSIMIQAGFFF